MTKEKILLVDDSSTALMMNLMVLKRFKQYDFITANDGQEAVDIALSERPDLILMDIVMPVMDGLQATKKIRATEGISDIPIILLTTRAEQEYVESGFLSGCNDYVNKPINAMELIAKIQSLLG